MHENYVHWWQKYFAVALMFLLRYICIASMYLYVMYKGNVILILLFVEEMFCPLWVW